MNVWPLSLQALFCSLDNRRNLVHHEEGAFAGQSVLDLGKDLEYMFTFFTISSAFIL